MTSLATVRSLYPWTTCLRGAAGKLLGVILVFLVPGTALWAQGPPVHWHHAAALPPGAIGRQRLLRGGPLPGYFQPVVIRAAAGVRVAVAVGDAFVPTETTPITFGLLVAAVYRLKVTDVPQWEGEEVFPTIEIIDRLYPPPGASTRFAIPVDITQQDLEAALEGRFVTRVIYVEDPATALPVASASDLVEWMDVRPGDDPLAVADRLGRPVAILRLGGRVPAAAGPDPSFLNGSPPLVRLAEPAAAR